MKYINKVHLVSNELDWCLTYSITVNTRFVGKNINKRAFSTHLFQIGARVVRLFYAFQNWRMCRYFNANARQSVKAVQNYM